MRGLLQNDFATLVARVLLGLLFIIASVDKLADPTLFAASIDNYRLFPSTITLMIATILPWLELLCGLAILSGTLQKGASFLVAFLLVIFTVAVITALARGLDITCGCFTQDPAAGTIGWMKVIENLGMVALAIFLFFSSSIRWTLEEYYATHRAE